MTRMNEISCSATPRPEAARPLEARPALQAGARPRRGPPDHLPRAAPHVRHRMAAAGTPMRTLQHWMGHADSRRRRLRALSAQRPGGRRRRPGVRVNAAMSEGSATAVERGKQATGQKHRSDGGGLGVSDILLGPSDHDGPSAVGAAKSSLRYSIAVAVAGPASSSMSSSLSLWQGTAGSRLRPAAGRCRARPCPQGGQPDRRLTLSELVGLGYQQRRGPGHVDGNIACVVLDRAKGSQLRRDRRPPPQVLAPARAACCCVAGCERRG